MIIEAVENCGRAACRFCGRPVGFLEL